MNTMPPQTLRCCMYALFFLQTICSEFQACRMGSPNSLADPYASRSESEEADKADEDSNGALLLATEFSS